MTSGTPKHECTDDDFESCPPRAGTGCFKYDSWEKGVIPLCVADMDVRCSQEILDTLAARVEHGVLGYGHETAALTQAALGWLKRQYDWDVAPEWLVWFPGIVSGMNVFLRAVGRLHAADSEVAAMVHVPAYPPFLTAPEQQRLRLVKVPLRCTSVEGKEQELHYEIDWEVFEQSVDAACRCYILCNPHNPTGRQWTDAELRELAAFCERHGLYVLSDEIWADLVLEGAHTPFAKLVAGTPLAARVVTTMAPSKTFNIAGLGCSLGIIPDAALRAQFVAAAAGIVPHINCLGLAAAETAWGGACDAWHAGLHAHLRRNLALVEGTLARCPRVRWSHPEATFVVWIDPRAAYPPGVREDNVVAWLAREHHIGLSDGKDYGQPGWVRLNFGCPTKTLVTALAEFEKAFGGSQ